MRVLHVLNSAYGGSALSTLQLIEELKVHGVTSSLVCLNNADAETESAIRSRVEGSVLFIPLYWANKRSRVKWWKRPLLELFTLSKTWAGYRYQREISALIRQDRIQLIHTSTLVNNEGAIAGRRHHLPHVWHARELIGPGTYYEFPQPLQWAQYVLSSCACLVANSKITEDNLRRYFPAEKVKYIPNGIPISGFKVRTHRAGNCVVGMIGNVTSTLKNHQAFIRMAVRLKELPHITFRIYGSLPPEADSYLSGLRGLITAGGMEERIQFMGHVSDVPSIAAELDVLFHPTEHESFGRIFIEAMAGGVPVIGMAGGGGEEMIIHGENGFLVEKNNPEQAALLVGKLADDPELRSRLGARGRRDVESMYDIRLTAGRIFNLYRQVIDSQKFN